MKLFHEIQALPGVRAEMIAAPRGFAVEKIIRANRYFLQSVQQTLHNLRRVVDALEQNRLVGNRNSRFLDHVARPLGVFGDFRRMIELGIEP